MKKKPSPIKGPPVKGRLTAEDEKLWHIVTRDVAGLEGRSPARRAVRRLAPYSASRQAQTHTDPYSGRDVLPVFTPSPLTGHIPATETFSLRDADPAWQQKLRRGRVRPEGKIDLHGMTQDRAYAALSRYIDQARHSGKRAILVITGKGARKTRDRDAAGDNDPLFGGRERGVLKSNVPRWLSQGELARHIVSYTSANRDDGGDGALYVVLKRVRE